MSLRCFGSGLSFLVAFFALSFGLSVLFPASAQQTGDAFSVRNVPVDVTAATVEAARDKAMIEGQRTALDILLRRLVASADLARLPVFTDREVVNLVIDFGIDNEKSSAVRYIAEMSVRFQPDAVRQILQKNNLAYAEWRGAPIAILPIWPSVIESNDVAENNPWRQAWLSGASQGVAPFAVQSAEQSAEAEQTLNAASQEDVEQFAQKIGAKDMLVSWVRIEETGGNILLTVRNRAAGSFAAAIEGTRNYQGPIQDGQEPLLKKAVADIVQTINDNFKSGNAVRQGKASSLSVVAPLKNGLSDWLAIREKLMRSAAVRGYEIKLLTRDRAALSLYYVGDQNQLEHNFVQNGLVLMWIDDHWELANSAQP